MGTSEQGLTEILAVAEHVNSLSALAEDFRPGGRLVDAPGGPPP